MIRLITLQTNREKKLWQNYRELEMLFYDVLRYNGHRVNQKYSNTVRLFRGYETTT